MRTENTTGFRGELRLLRLGGGVSVCSAALQPVRFLRTPGLIRGTDPAYYHLVLPLDGTADTSQNGRRARHGARQAHIIDSTRPYDCVFSEMTAVTLHVPRARLPLPPGRTEKLLASPLPAQDGVGGLLADLLTRIVSSGPWKRSDGPRLEGFVVDLFSATVAHHVEAAGGDLAPERRGRTPALQIRDYIERNLNDPDLTPAAVAHAHHMSLRSLHRHFRTEETTVGALIRSRRLERARRDLMDPGLAGLAIHAIAARWGFRSHADFTHAFRAAYGMPPSEQRRRDESRAPTLGAGGVVGGGDGAGAATS